jgi:hypothetical protein
MIAQLDCFAGARNDDPFWRRGLTSRSRKYRFRHPEVRAWFEARRHPEVRAWFEARRHPEVPANRASKDDAATSP